MAEEKKIETEEELSSVDKAAALLVLVGSKNAAQILKHMTSEEVEKVTIAVSRMKYVSKELKNMVIEELHQKIAVGEDVSRGGQAFAQEVLDSAVGSTRADTIMQRVNILAEEKVAFKSLKNVDMGQLSSFLQQEQPQTIALILSYLEPVQSAMLLSSLSEEVQGEVVVRIATLEQIDPEIVRQVDGVLRTLVASSYAKKTRSSGGAKSVAEILNFVDRSAEKSILRTLEEREQELAEEVKKLMFVFEDIILVEDRSMQRVLKEVDTSEISLALKASSDEVKEKVFKNISKRAAEMIKEEIEFMGPVRLKDVEEAQQRIVNVVRRLEEEGEIVISGRGGGGEEIIV